MNQSQPVLARPAIPRARAMATPRANPTPHAQLTRLASTVERRASNRGLAIEFIGVESLFTEPRIYGEGYAPWVLCPGARDPMVVAGLPIPDRQRRRLKAFVDAGMDFPHIYLAHELAKRPAHHAGKPVLDHHRVLSDSEMKHLLVRPEAPAATRQTAKRLDRIARTLGKVMTATAVAAGAVAAAPLLLLDGLDPAVLGALTLPGAQPGKGTPAAWFLLAHWDW